MRSGLFIGVFFAVTACSGEVYLRDGVTDGDTFYLADRALTDSDPAYQGWVRYSLARSACQLGIGGDNPARATSFDCEVRSRRLLAESWQEAKAGNPAARNIYLDDLVVIYEAGFLDEYVAGNFRKNQWDVPTDLRTSSYRRWMKSRLPHHEPETRLTGSWNYAGKVSGQ
ncbi:MAG: hypothetical protein OEV41_00165 [Gammaproteobacteria bacterium]|nr:hypothetical protein [Gammaproteobacteria bacterium]MDH5344247.1 hypothetical protein [Gammaproteobacteria bacterium]